MSSSTFFIRKDNRNASSTFTRTFNSRVNATTAATFYSYPPTTYSYKRKKSMHTTTIDFFLLLQSFCMETLITFLKLFSFDFVLPPVVIVKKMILYKPILKSIQKRSSNPILRQELLQCCHYMGKPPLAPQFYQTLPMSTSCFTQK